MSPAFSGHSPAETANNGERDFLDPGPYSALRSDIPEFGSLFSLIRATLEHDKVGFRGSTGMVRGFAAGAAYPQIWLRDAATIVPASRFFYSAPYLRSWLVEHLARQLPGGALMDWFDGRGAADKNTTESDQETSAVLAAGRITDLCGPEWLAEKIGGRPLLTRLDDALRSVLTGRLDAATGLIQGAHTVDWGDVEMEESDRNAIYAGPRTHWTAGIYNQAQFYGAAIELSRLFRRVGRADKAAFWADRAADVRRNADRLLWQEERGFYRVHIHLTPLVHAFDESDMFALGGNAEAAISGLAEPSKIRRIIETALARQKRFGISTVSGVLLPPYPAGLFKHASLDHPYEYQNGGQWDWFGGRLVLAMFENGFAAEGRDKLIEIARKDILQRGLFEWDTPAGKGRGSDFYAGSAGSLTRALIEGYFGIRAADDRLTLAPRLGRESGAVHLFIPANGRFIAYEFRFDGGAEEITFSFHSDWTRRGTLKIRWPARLNEGRAAAGPPRFEVRRDGVPIAYATETIGRDTSVVVESDLGRHTLTIRGQPAL